MSANKEFEEKKRIELKEMFAFAAKKEKERAISAAYDQPYIIQLKPFEETEESREGRFGKYTVRKYVLECRVNNTSRRIAFTPEMFLEIMDKFTAAGYPDEITFIPHRSFR